MARFFIDRPIFAWVVALFIMVIGAVSITQLPVSQYPQVAPPTINVTATYPGASAAAMDEAVLSVIEREMNGATGLIYMESTSQANGTGQIAISFQPGTNPELAQVDVQNRLSRATPRLPPIVVQQGVRVDKASSNFLMVVSLTTDGSTTSFFELADLASRSVLPEIQRVPGVGTATMFAAERALRVWVDPARLTGYNLSVTDVNNAIRAQNAQVASGAIGDQPAISAQATSATVVVPGQLTSPEAFGEIVLRANADGSSVRLKDVARIELGIESYANASRLNGKPAVSIGVQLTPTGNALATAQAIRDRVAELSPFFPQGVNAVIPFDTSNFVRISIKQVAETLVEAMVLVFLVMYLFLQDWRYTLIPTLVVPVALLGTFAVLAALGMSINVLSMFGMVLVIGIVVDDAIVVVENVERIMSEEGLPPLQATIKAMGQISGAIIGVTVVLIAVFVPLALFGGAIGNIYRQFAVTMVGAIAFSAFMALSLTPALCGTLLKPVSAGHHLEKRGFFGAFNRMFARTQRGYASFLGGILKRGVWMAGLYLLIAAVVALVYQRLPTSFLPNEDQGYLISNVQLPSGATQQRTLNVMEQMEGYLAKQPEVGNVVTVLGFSFTGRGQNAALAFIPLKDWSEREAPGSTAQSLAGRASGQFQRIRDAFIFVLSPPPIPALGNSTGFSFRLQDRGAQGYAALTRARDQLIAAARKSPVLANVRAEGLPDGSQLRLDIDRDKASALGVDFGAINTTISTALGSSYVNDFPNSGRLQRVIVQADATARMQPDDLLRLNVVNNRGQIVPLSAFASTSWVTGPTQLTRYNGYPAMKIEGDAAPGRSTGEALVEMERLAAELPPGFAYEWTRQSREEKIAGGTGLTLYAFSVLAIFLCLAALYESWSIPLAVILVVPLGVLGVVLAVLGHKLPNDVYFEIGLVTIIGLSAKNAILIIEFAKDLQAQGHDVAHAALEAARMRFRPILMTSLAFSFGVLPLYLASGASSASQRAIGTGVLGGMISGTVLAVFFVPTFFAIVRRYFKGSKRQQAFESSHAAALHGTGRPTEATGPAGSD